LRFEVLCFNFRVIQLNRFNWRDFLDQQNPVASALMAKMNIVPEERPRMKAECLRSLTTLRLNPAKTKLISGFVDTYLLLNAAEEQRLLIELGSIEPIEQQRVMEIATSWMERGIEQGRQEGEVALITRQLKRRLGTVTPEVEARIRHLSIEQLENLGEALLDFFFRCG
jgi:predicted transposase YdaD